MGLAGRGGITPELAPGELAKQLKMAQAVVNSGWPVDDDSGPVYPATC